MQNANQRTGQQRLDYEAKLKRGKKIIRACVELAKYALSLGAHVEFEQPLTASSWGYRPLRLLRQQLWECRISGC
eukprot:12095782-Alexandrium_andersonii.AAC.1